MKLIVFIATLLLVSACATTGVPQSQPYVSPPEPANRQAMFSWAVEDLILRLQKGNVNELTDVYADIYDARKENVNSPENSYNKLRSKILIDTMVVLFQSQSIAISNINEPQQTVDLKLLDYPELPRIWHFELEIDKQSYAIKNYHSKLRSLNMESYTKKQLVSLQRLMNKHPELSTPSFAELSESERYEKIADTYAQREFLNPTEARYLINLSSVDEKNSTTTMLERYQNIINRTYVGTTQIFDGILLEAAVIDKDYATALVYLNKLEDRIHDQSTFYTSKAFYLLKLNRLTESAAEVRKALSFEVENPWPYAIAKIIADKQNNSSLQEDLQLTYKTFFGTHNDLNQLTQAINEY